MPIIEIKHKIIYPVSNLERMLEGSLARYDVKLPYPDRIWYTKPSGTFGFVRQFQAGKAAITYHKSLEDEIILKELLFGSHSDKTEVEEILERYIRENELFFRLGEAIPSEGNNFTLKSSKSELKFETYSMRGLKLFFKALNDYCQATIKEEQVFERELGVDSINHPPKGLLPFAKSIHEFKKIEPLSKLGEKDYVNMAVDYLLKKK